MSNRRSINSYYRVSKSLHIQQVEWLGGALKPFLQSCNSISKLMQDHRPVSAVALDIQTVVTIVVAANSELSGKARAGDDVALNRLVAQVKNRVKTNVNNIIPLVRKEICT